jgi:DNA repair protein RadA
MAKSKTLFFCKECGYESSKWLGQCPGCKQWDTFVEEPVAGRNHSASPRKDIKEPVLLSDVIAQAETRMKTGLEELDRVLGGGIVPGSLVLVGGDPGIGKSTLLLQMSREIVKQGRKVIYISGEESGHQIKMRADRLGAISGELLLLCETNLDLIETVVHKHKPDIVVIDSIQTMYREDIASAPGSVSQVREATGALMRLAKESTTTIFIIGHVTKEGMVAGPKVLEHMVDTVLYFEGDNFASYRVLRAVKNRFGSTNEIGVFEMQSSGLKEVKNPSEYMLSGRPVGEPGSVVTSSVEGTRPILVEVQALISRTSFNMPRRTAAGTDYNRVNLLMAVLEKRLGLQLGDCDAYVNVAGGMRITEPALDLAIVAAILSSYRNTAISGSTVVFGEIGLTGEIRAVNMADQRVAEAAKMGFETCILPKANEANIKVAAGIKLVGINNIQEFMQYIKENAPKV